MTLITRHLTRRRASLGARLLRGALAVVLTATALLTGAATAAEAHEVLVGTSPAERSTVAVAPAKVSITFDEPGQPTTTKSSSAASGVSTTSPITATTGASGSSTPAGTASTAGRASTLPWVVGAGVLLLSLLLTAAYLVTRTPRSTPQCERDPKS